MKSLKYTIIKTRKQYIEYCNIVEALFTSDNKMMSDETWLNAKEMKRMKIIDKIINTNKKVELVLSNEIEERYAICNNILKNKN